MREVFLLTVGKLKNEHLKILEEEYLKRITNIKLEIIELKSEISKNQEAREVLKKIQDIGLQTNPFVILLTEHGKTNDSVLFAKWWGETLEIRREKIILVIAGADGPADELISRANYKLSLSPMTFAHQLARIILIEQLYRAQTILQNHPYHK